MTDDNLDARFDHLAAATNDVGPRPDFADRVMLAVESEEVLAAPGSVPADWLRGVLVTGRFALGVAALAAVVAVGFALQSQTSHEAAVMLTYDTVEVGW